MDPIIMKETNIVTSMMIDEKRKKVAELIKTTREQRGWTQTELGDRVGFTKSTILRIENCTFSPNADQLYVILDCLDLTLKIDNEKI